MAEWRDGGGALRWKDWVVASITMNIAWLAMFIRRRYFGGSSRSDGNNGGGGEVTTVEPSKGKPSVTSDSIVNLDQ